MSFCQSELCIFSIAFRESVSGIIYSVKGLSGGEVVMLRSRIYSEARVEISSLEVEVNVTINESKFSCIDLLITDRDAVCKFYGFVLETN